MSIVLGIGSDVVKTGWALVERADGQERLLGYGLLEAVDWEIVADFAARMAVSSLPIDLVVIEDAAGAGEDLRGPSRLVGRWLQAFEMLGLDCHVVGNQVWQRQLLAGLEGRGEPRKATKAWAREKFREALRDPEAGAAGIATWQLRRSAEPPAI